MSQPTLHTARLTFEPTEVRPAAELVALFADPKLHRFVPFAILTLEERRERLDRLRGGQELSRAGLCLGGVAGYL